MEIRQEIAAKLEREKSEIEALEAQMEKSLQLSKQVSSVMDSIDGRLLRLETTILPFHGSTQKLSKIYENMDKAITQLDIVLAYIDAAGQEEPILSVAPSKVEELDTYFQSINRLREAYTFISVTARLSHADHIKSTQKSLLIRATSNLESLLRLWIEQISHVGKEHFDAILELSSQVDPVSQSTTITLPSRLFALDVIDHLIKIVDYLATYQTDLDIHGTAAPNTDYSKAIIEIRSKYLSEMLTHFFKGDLKHENTGLYVKGSSHFLNYIRVLLYAFQLEWALIMRIIPSNVTGTLSQSRNSRINNFKSVFEAIILPSISQYSGLADGLLVKTRRSIVQGHDFSSVFILMDLLDMIYLNSNVAVSLQLNSLKHIGKKISGIRNSFNQFTATCFKTFTEFLDEIRHSSSKNSQLPEDGIVHELSSNTLGFVKWLIDYKEIAELLLRTLENLPRWEEFLFANSPTTENDDLFSKVCQVRDSMSTKLSGNDDNQFLSIQKFCIEALDLLTSNLEAKAKSYKKGLAGEKSSKMTLSTIFLLNNYHFILKSLRGSEILLQIIGKPVETRLAIRMQEEMDMYMESWKPLLSGLMNPSGAKLMKGNLSKGERNTIKDIFKSFNDEFDEQYKHQKKYAVPDIDLRSQIVRNVKQLIVPLYSRVYDRYKSVDFTKNPEKYLKYDINGLETTISRFFDPLDNSN